MKFSLLFLITCVPILFSSVTINDNNNDRFIFFLHNRFLEIYDLNESHPTYGRAEYLEIIKRAQRDNSFPKGIFLENIKTHKGENIDQEYVRHRFWYYPMQNHR